jgi:hypothetical protein
MLVSDSLSSEERKAYMGRRYATRKGRTCCWFLSVYARLPKLIASTVLKRQMRNIVGQPISLQIALKHMR